MALSEIKYCPLPNLNLTGLTFDVILLERWGEEFTCCCEIIDFEAPLSKRTSMFFPFGSRPLVKF